MQRFPEDLKGKSSAVVSDGVVYAVAFDPGCEDGIKAQTSNALSYLDVVLGKAGSAKDKLLQVTVYLSDISLKPDMDNVWNEWIGGQEYWPQRACVGVSLHPGYLIEIVVIAKVQDT